MQDLLNEFERVAEIKKSELYGLQSGGRLTDRNEKLLRAIEKRLAGHRKNSKNEDMTVNQMLHHFNARLCKPQRLVSLTYEEEERRALRSWNRFDWKLNVACFRPLEELANLVRDPQGFRENVRDLVIYMNDQIPMWLKVKPGKQAYADWELRKKKYERNLGSLSGGGTQSKDCVLQDDDEDEIEGPAEGMTQLRGEASKDQDKFRVTVEREQICRGFCDDTTEPTFEPGTTSLTFTGAHFRMSNVKWPEEVWLNTEEFWVNGQHWAVAN